jgi:hypothetical protein
MNIRKFFILFVVVHLNACAINYEERNMDSKNTSFNFQDRNKENSIKIRDSIDEFLAIGKSTDQAVTYLEANGFIGGRIPDAEARAMLRQFPKYQNQTSAEALNQVSYMMFGYSRIERQGKFIPTALIWSVNFEVIDGKIFRKSVNFFIK